MSRFPRRRGGKPLLSPQVSAIPSATPAAPPHLATKIASTKTVTQWPLDQLKDHPRQQKLFGDIAAAELSELAENMARYGLEYAIEILPDGVIVAGHQRVRAAKQLGWPAIDVVVRDDLGDAESAAVEQRMIDDNLLRRQLRPIDIAMLYRRLKELEEKSEAFENGDDERLSLRNRVAAKIGAGVGGRTLDRYERILDAPLVIRQAVKDNRLAMTTALRLMSLSKGVLNAAVRRIEAGEDPRRVAEILRQPGASSTPTSTYRRLLATLRAAIHEIGPMLPDVVVRQGDEPTNAIAVLRESIALMQQLLQAEVQREVDSRTVPTTL